MADLILIYSGKVKNGELKIVNRPQFNRELEYFEGKDVEVQVRKKRKKRSLMQNAYYFGVVVPCVVEGLKDAGYRVNRELAHEFLKSKFAREEIVNEETGEVLSIIGSTAKMTTSKMMDYFAEITQWAAEYLNIQIPLPGEQTEIDYGKE